MNKKSNNQFKSGKHFAIILILILLISCSGKEKVQKTDVFEPEASLEEASSLIKKGYYEEAREKLETIKAKDASLKYATIVKLRIADSYFEDELYEEAAVEYASFLDVHQQHKYASYAQYKLAMSYYKRIKTPDVSYSWAQRAMAEFEKLQRLYPRNPYMDVTETRINACKRILAEHEFYVGEFYFKKGSYGAAINRLNGMINQYPESRKVSEALYYLGVSYENMGNRDSAIHALSALVEKFPSTELSKEARDLLTSFNQK